MQEVRTVAAVCQLCKERYPRKVFVCRVCGNVIFGEQWNIVVSSGYVKLRDLSYLLMRYPNHASDEYLFQMKNPSQVRYESFFRSDIYIDQMMEVIYYSFHHYGFFIGFFFSMTVILRDATGACCCCSSDQDELYTVSHHYDPRAIRKLFVDIRNADYQELSRKLSGGDYTFYQFQQVIIHLRPLCARSE